MPTLTSIVLTGCLALSLTACSSGSPHPVLPNGLHRVPVNRVPPVPEVPTPDVPVPAAPVSPDLPASPGDGARS